MDERNQITIRFGGDGNIHADTLTTCLRQYTQLLYLINQELGYNPNDLIVEVSPPENGSFKIKLKPKYKDLILDKIGDLSTATFAGLILLYASNASHTNDLNEIKKLLVNHNVTETEAPKVVYNIYQNTGARQSIEHTFVVINDDENITDLIIEQNDYELINVPKSEFPKIIKENILEEPEEIAESDVLKDEATLIIKTIHFEGHAKWAFIFRGYPIKATIKDTEFIERLNDEPFRKGDSLRVILSRNRNYDADLQTYIVDQTSYTIEKVIKHTSKSDNQHKLDLK